MSRRSREGAARRLTRNAPVFAALGDETRLSLVTKLSEGSQVSIARLAEGTSVTRQAITKHLKVLEGAGLVRGIRRGRENLFALAPEPLDEARRALDRIARHWDEALARLKDYVER